MLRCPRPFTELRAEHALRLSASPPCLSTVLNLYKAGDGFVADSMAAEQVQHAAATGRCGEDRVAVGGASPLGNLRAYAAAIELAIERRNRSQVYLRCSRSSMCTSMLGSTRSLRDRVERVPAATVPCFGPAGPRPLELLRHARCRAPSGRAAV